MESDCSVPTVSDNSVGRLKELLKKESRSHRDTGQCYDTLQKEYDELLQKYAQAENTIDKLRIETLREKIELCRGQADNKEFIEQYNKAWQCVYDDLLYRTNKLQGAVSEFQSHLSARDYSSHDEVHDIFDSLHTDFEHIANAFQSMQALGVKASYNNDPANNENAGNPEESILTDDLEGNLYRLGLRLEEIQDEIGDKLQNDDITQPDDNSNYSVSPKNHHYQKRDQKRSFDGVYSENELMNSANTRKNNNVRNNNYKNNNRKSLDSDDNDRLELDIWKPATEDITELNYYKHQLGKQYLGLDPMYLSRSNSAPGELSARHLSGPTANTPNDCVQDLPDDTVDASSQKKSKSKIPTKKLSTVALGSLNLQHQPLSPTSSASKKKKKTPSPPKKITQQQGDGNATEGGKVAPSTSLASQKAPSVPSTHLTSTEDSGFLDGSHPSQHTFPSRHASSPLRIDETQPEIYPDYRGVGGVDAIGLEDSTTGERYRQRLDSLRNYILSKRQTNNSPFTAELTERRRGTAAGGTGRRKNRQTSRSFNRGNSTSHDTFDLGSSTSESVISMEPLLEEKPMSASNLNRTHSKRREQRLPIHREDIDTLRHEMRNVRDVVLDLRNSLTSPPDTRGTKTSPLRTPEARLNTSTHSTRREDLRSPPRGNGEEVEVKEVVQEADDEEEVFEEEDKQLRMLGQLDKKLDDISKRLKASSSSLPLEQKDKPTNNSRSSSRRQNSRLDSPSRHSHVSSYFNQVGEEYDEDQRNDFVDARSRKHPQTYTFRNHSNVRGLRQTQSFRQARPSSRHHFEGNRRRESCDDLLIARDSYGSPAQVYTHRPRSGARDGRVHGRVYSPPNYQSEDEDDVELNPHMVHRDDALNDSGKSFDDKFLEIGEQMKDLATRVQENKEKEERQQRDETLKQQRQLVEYLGDKLEKLSMRIEEKEKEKTVNGLQVPGDASSPTPVFVVPCPLCGHVGVHQHGGRFFNGYNLVTLPEHNVVHNMTSHGGNMTTSHRGVKDDVVMMQSTPVVVTPTKGWEGERTGTPSVGNRPLSPRVYHHYHTVITTPNDEQQPQVRTTTTVNEDNRVNVTTPVSDIILTKRMCSSLEKASLAALQMENLSRKMLKGISTDLFNSGPSEF